MIVVLLIAASSGPVRVWSDPPPRGPSTPAEGFRPPADGPAVGQGSLIPPPAGEDGDGWVMRVLAIVVGVMLVRWAWIVVRFWVEVLRRRRDRRIEPAGEFVAMPGAVVDEAPDITLDMTAQIGALTQGSARNAIVACWLRLEDDIAAAGLARTPSETSAELTERVLAHAAVDNAAVLELADLYREARFSKHELGDAERARARSALQRIHASLRGPVSAASARAGTVPM
jgi:hypothetical protein